ncbi:MAG: ROK family protein [Flavobacteriia bacterium]|nr:ROK family protein [Flavobacteriia bacterium]
MSEHYALGIDIGGTNTVYGLVNKNGNVIIEKSLPTPNYNEPTDLINAIYNDLNENHSIDKIIGIGIGAPNGNHFTGNIEYAPNLKWKGIVPLAQMFQDKFHKPSILTNDANAAAMGEMLFGNAKDLKHFVTITLGTGVGSGVVIDGQIVYGENGFAGEYGHIRIIPNGRLCGCGRKGCLETYASSTGLIRSITELESLNKENSVLLSIQNPTAKNVFEEAEKGDVFASEIIEFTAEILGSSLADFACFSNPKAFILFGGIAQSGPEFAEKVKFYFEQNALKIYQDKIEIRTSSLHGKNAAVLGSAASMFWKVLN